MNKQMDIKSDCRVSRGSPALLHEMLRSFTVLARTLNLSQAVEELGSTRQTVRRHISQLEEAIGGKLFEVEHRRYALTELGERATTPAQLILDKGEAWYNGNYDFIGGMNRFSHDEQDGWGYHQQEQPLSGVWEGRSDLMRAAVCDWATAQGQLEHPAMQRIRPYMIVYRDSLDSWICTEIGEKSFYANWFGWAQARSSVGRPLDQFPGGDRFANLINIPFADIQSRRGLRLDQVLLYVPRSDGGPRDMLVFERLLMGGRLPDGSPALISIVDRPCDLRITGVDPAVLDDMPLSAAIDFLS
ncbi:LysR family transcriptional regulator [Sulfitobacter sp. HNIBRBA3233]|uniref:helix-turn-helix domain-containing protein n=1 Tax=Sulfitobacter marinivivus TaxID=3158558 RepID=UPI0032DF843C